MGEFSISKDINIEEEMAEASRRWHSFPEVEKQKREWDRGVRNPALMKKAEKIIDNLHGRRFTLDSLSVEYFEIYVNYLILTAKKKGYRLRPDLMQFPWFVYEKNEIRSSRKEAS